MPGENIIDLGFDYEKLDNQKKRVVDALMDVYNTAKKLDGIKMQISGIEGLGDLAKILPQLKKNQDELATQVDKLNKLYGDNAKAIEATKIQITQRRAELKNLAKEEAAAEGSIDKLRAAYNRLSKEYDALSESERNSSAGQSLLKNVSDLDQQIKKLEADTGRFQRNVGNYTAAVKILEPALTEIKQKIDDFTKSGNGNEAQLKRLQTEEKALTAIMTNQAAGFANMRQEIKANQSAIESLTRIYGEDSDVVKQLIKENAQLRDSYSDLVATQKTLGSDTFGFDAAVQGAQTLVGIYGIGEASAALFGQKNEELQKTLVKLNAVMTIIQSSQAIMNSLQKESALVQGALALKEKALTGFLILKNFVLTGNVAASKAAATASLQQAAATKVQEVAAKGATTAMIGLRTALIASGIGALLVLLLTIANAMSEFSKSSDKAAESYKTLNREIEISNEKLDENIRKINLQTALDLEKIKQRGGTQVEQSDRIIEGYKQEAAAFDKAAQDKKKSVDKLVNSGINIDFIFGTKIDLSSVEAAKKTLRGLEDFSKSSNWDEGFREKYDALVNGIKATVADLEKSTSKNDEQLKAEAQKQTEIIKQNNDNRIKLALESARIASNTVIDQNNRILADETTTNTERLDLMRSNLTERLNILRAENNAIQNDIFKSSTDKILAEKNYQYQRKKLIADSNAEIEKERKKQQENDLRDTYELAKIKLQQLQKSQEEIANDEKKPYLDRLEALGNFYDTQVTLERTTATYLLSNAKLSAKQRQAIELDSYNKQLDLYKNYQKRLNDLRLNAQNSYEKALTDINDKDQKRLEKNRDNTLDALNQQFKLGLISQKEYNKEREKIIHESTVRILKDQIAGAEALLEGAQGDDILKAETALAKARVALSDYETDHKIKNNEKWKSKTIEVLSEIQGYTQQAFDIIGSLIDANIDREKNRLQERIDNIDVEKAAEIDRINASTDSEEKKAAKIKIVEAKAQNDRELLQRRQRQLDLEKARFDRAKAIADIILNTAAAVVKALPNIPLSILVGTLGAIQLGVALAAPLPKYKTGRGKGKDELAIVDDGGVPEAIVRGDGTVEIGGNKPRMTFLGADDIVLPTVDDLFRDARNSSDRKLSQIMSVNPNGKLEAMNSQQIEELRKVRSAIASLPDKITTHHWGVSNGQLKQVSRNGYNEQQRFINETQFFD